MGFLLALLAAALLQAQSTVPPGTDTTAAPPATIAVTDETGRRVQVPVEVRRIVSLAPNMTEMVYALGLQDKLAGVTDYCDYPPEARTKTRVGGIMNPSIEQVVSLHPDLVLASRQSNRRETVETLTRLGVAVYASDARTVEDVLASTRRLGSLLGAKEQGEALAAELHKRLKDLEQRLAGHPPQRVVFVVWPSPLISIGRHTFLADALRWAGAESVVDTPQDWPRLSIEEVLRQEPEFLVFASSHANETAGTFEDLRQQPGWRELKAMKERHIAVISEAVNRPSPRLVDAIEQLARQLHPDAFQPAPDAGKEKRENRRTDGRAPFSRLAAIGESFLCAR
jgi:iron complex transport system substrate-binding protein